MKKISKPSATQMVVKELNKYLVNYEGDYLPSETKLAELLDVSRLTIREAVSIVEREGFVTKQQGKGTLVNRYVSRLENRVDIDNDIENILKNRGYKVKYTINKYETQKKSKDKKFNLLEGEEILVIEKFLWADNNVVAIYIDKIPMKYFIEDVKKEDFMEYIFPIVERLTGKEINTEVVQIKPVLMDDYMQKVFSLKEKSPMVCFEVAHYSNENGVLMTSTENYTDEWIDFHIVRNAKYK